MNIDADTLEKAAFACFNDKLEDNYKRLLFLSIEKVMQENPNISRNRCFFLTKCRMTVLKESDFDCAIAALKIPFKRIDINEYRARRTKQGSRHIMHLVLTESDDWNLWTGTVKERYPELSIWLR